MSWAAVVAQDTLGVMTVHKWGGRTERLTIDKVDSITMANMMTVHFQGGHQRDFDIDWISYLTVDLLPKAEAYEAVDLGLSVQWAAVNIGASLPEQYGDYYAWGETTSKDDYSEATYAYYKNDGYTLIGTNICATTYDVAHATWGGTWRLPTRSEIHELTSRCTWAVETLNGVRGYRVTGTTGNSIFLPAAGYRVGTELKEEGTGGFYWTGNVNRSMTSAAYNLNFRGYDDDWPANRTYGFTVRAVK